MLPGLHGLVMLYALNLNLIDFLLHPASQAIISTAGTDEPMSHAMQLIFRKERWSEERERASEEGREGKGVRGEGGVMGKRREGGG